MNNCQSIDFKHGYINTVRVSRYLEFTTRIKIVTAHYVKTNNQNS